MFFIKHIFFVMKNKWDSIGVICTLYLYFIFFSRNCFFLVKNWEKVILNYKFENNWLQTSRDTFDFCEIDSNPNTFALLFCNSIENPYLFSSHSRTTIQDSFKGRMFPFTWLRHAIHWRPLERFSEDITVYRGESFSARRVPLYTRISKNIPSNWIHNSYILQRP